jgi:ADP-heptose:LPS heptosyltransferase
MDTLLLGGSNDRDLAISAVAAAQTRLVNLVGRTSLREAVGIIQRAAVAIGPDSGLMHIAAAVQTPVISLWGATDPGRTGPYGFANLTIQGNAPCVPCNRRSCTIGRICLQSIAAEQIAEKLAVVLGQRKTKNFAHLSSS